MIVRHDRWALAGLLNPGGTQLPAPGLPFDGSWLNDWDDWLRREEIPPRTPFLISPAFEYDVVLNSFFLDVQMAASPPRTREGYAGDLAAFNFLWQARDGKSWRGGVTRPGRVLPGRRGTVR